MTNEQKSKAVFLFQNGATYNAVSEELNIPVGTLKSFYRRSALGQGALGVCAECGVLLKHTEGKRKKRFCSDKCRLSWWSKHPEQRNKKYSHKCETCGAYFTNGKSDAKFCCRTCYYRYRKKAGI